MENEQLPSKPSNNLVTVSFLYNIALLLFFTILMLIIQEWYMMAMLLFIDRHCFSKALKNIDSGN